MPKGTPEMEFWFEFASPYSYLTVQRIDALAAGAGVSVIWRPFLLGPVFAAQGWNTSPFVIYPAKGRYMWRDVERCAADRGLARYRKPEIFPQHTLLAARCALCVLDADMGTNRGAAFVRALFEANFERGPDLSQPEVIAEALRATGLEPALLESAVEPQTKARLRAQTQNAMALGLFGAPSFCVGDEVYWGDDRLEQALAHARTREAAT